MATGVLLTGIIALLSFKMSVVTDVNGSIVALTEFGNAIYLSGLKWVVMLAPLAIVFYMSFGINKMSSFCLSQNSCKILLLMAQALLPTSDLTSK